MRLPPRWVRRTLVEPLFVLITVLVTVLSPLLLALAAIASPLTPGRWRPLRALAYALVWMHREVAVIAACTWLWLVAAGRVDTPAMRRRHYALMRWFLRGARRHGERALGVHVRVGDDGIAEAKLRAHDGPLLVLSRHSGPGDTLYLVDMLLDRYGREPRIVMKDILKLDPCIDLAGSRLPNYFVPPRRRRTPSWISQLSALAAGLDERGALLLFPEGGNFTEERRRQRLRRLLRRGRRAEAERAVRMHHVIAPEPGGALAALAAAPGASVVLVAHGGLAGLDGGLLGRAPMDRDFVVQLWYIDRADVPPTEDERRQWLLDCWQRVDAWVATTAGDQALRIG